MTEKQIQRGSVSRVGDDSGPIPLTQVEAYGEADDAAVVWPYGMHGNLPINSTTVTFLVNGQSESRAVIGYRPDLRSLLIALRPEGFREGEMIFGNFLTKTTTFYDEDGNLIVNCEGDEKVVIKGASEVDIDNGAKVTTPLMTFDGDLTITGKLIVQGAAEFSATVTSNGKDISDTHTHAGSPTAPTGAISPTGPVP